MFEGQKILWVAGGRNYDDGPTVKGALYEAALVNGYDILITGAAPGADLLAEQIWRTHFQAPYIGMPARWQQYGKRAGIYRNIWIGDEMPAALLAFPGGKGTAHARDIAEARGIPIINGS